MNDKTTRRGFLQAAAVAAGTAALTSCDDGHPNQKQWAKNAPKPTASRPSNTSLQQCFGDVIMKDHNGQQISLEEKFANQPVIILFGVAGCEDMCMGNKAKNQYGIVDTIKAMQLALSEQGKEIPIVLIDTMPERVNSELAQGKTSQTAAAHMQEYRDRKIKETFDDGRPAFTIAYGPTSLWTEELQSDKLGLLQDKGNALQHAPFLTVFVGGKQQQFEGSNKIMLNGLRALPRNPDAPHREFDKLGKQLAADIIGALPSQTITIERK